MPDIRILIADNDTTIRELVRDALEAFGFRQITFASSGQQAWELMEQHRFDLMIFDWEMPPLSGISLVKRLRNSPSSPDRTAPIILLTGRAEKENVEAARDAGVTEFLAKPFSIEALRQRIVAAFDQPRSFVVSENFHGPDRRRHEHGRAQDGTERRKTTPKAY